MTEASGPAMGQPAGAPASTASLGARFGARVLDVVILIIPMAIIFFVLAIFMTAIGFDSWLIGAIFSLLWFGYYVFFESTTGATLGKKILGLRVVAADGSPPSTEAAAKRNAWMLLGLIPTFVGDILGFIAMIVIAVTISSNEYNRGKHDEFADTGVMAS